MLKGGQYNMSYDFDNLKYKANINYILEVKKKKMRCQTRLRKA